MRLKLSSTLSITIASVPPMQLIERSMTDPGNMTTDQHQQIIGFTAVLTALQDYASPDDEEAVSYVSKYYSYFCNHYVNYSSLPEEAKLSFQVANYSDFESFMGRAYASSNCAPDYFDF